jgi:hypothetical protein
MVRRVRYSISTCGRAESEGGVPKIIHRVIWQICHPGMGHFRFWDPCE